MTIMPEVPRRDFWGDARPTALATNLLAGATSLSVTPGGLATWGPVISGLFSVVVNRGKADEEHLYATAISGDSLTGLVRGQDGTADQPHSPGATVEHGLLADDVRHPNQFLSLPSAKGQLAASAGADKWAVLAAGADGETVVYDSLQATGFRPTRTLAGYTFTGPTVVGGTFNAPTVADFTNAQHDHGDADDGGLLPTAPAGASAPGDTASAGAATTYSRTDHRHLRETFAAPVASAPGDALAAGVSPSVARADHLHGREPWANTVAMLTIGGAGSPGTVGHISRADHVHGVPPAVEVNGPGNEKAQRGTANWTLSAATSVSVTVTFPVQFGSVPTVTFGLQQGASSRCAAIMTAKSATAVTFLVFRPDNTSASFSGSLDWAAMGTP